MVTVIGYDKRESEEGKEFFTLTIQGGVEVVQSQNGKNYITARRISISSTFDEATCELMIGKQLPGQIIKQACEPYEYENKNTGEVTTLYHNYEYISEEEDVSHLNFEGINGFASAPINKGVEMGAALM